MANNKETEQLLAEIENLKGRIETQEIIIEALQKAVEDLNAKIDGVHTVVSSINVNPDAVKKEKPRDPGPVKVGDKAYKFKFLKFRMAKQGGGGLITYTAEEAARDPEVVKNCIALGILVPA